MEVLRAAGVHPLVSGFPEGAIVVFDGDLQYLSAGGHGLSLVGLTREMIEGKTIYEVFPYQVSSVLEPSYHRALSGEDVTLDIDFGGRTYMHRIGPLTDSTGVIVAGIGFALDVTEERQSRSALAASEERLRRERHQLREAEAVGHSGSWEWDTVTNVITWSDGLFALHGLDPMTFDGGYAQAASRVHPDDRERVDAALESCRRNEAAIQFRYRVARARDGATRWFDSRASGVFEDGKLVRLRGAVADVTEQVLAEAEVIEANAFLQAVIAASPDYTFITNVQTGAMTYGSRGSELLGGDNEQTEVLGSDAMEALVHPEDQAALRAMNAEAARLKDGEVLQFRYRRRHADGQWHWLSRHVVPFRRDKAGRVVEVLGVLRDVTDAVRAEEQLSHDALHDTLTGLPNRALLLDRLQEALDRSARDGREIAVLFCDLDGFKAVNDSAGHGAGDAVLVETAQRLRGALRESDTVARVGGDEFVLVVDPWKRNDIGGRTASDRAPIELRGVTERLADRVIDAMRRPFRILGVDHVITISIGIAYQAPSLLDGANASRARQVIEEADAAMYRAKHEGKNRVEVFA